MPAGERVLAYFDTSVLAKCYVAERGSNAALAAATRHVVVSSVVAPVELASALRRRRDAGELMGDASDTVERRLRADRGEWRLRAVDALVLERAERIARSFVVRALDALHLASALAVGEEAGRAVPFVTGDDRQRVAAVALGLDVLFVE